MGSNASSSIHRHGKKMNSNKGSVRNAVLQNGQDLTSKDGGSASIFPAHDSTDIVNLPFVPVFDFK